MSRGIRSSWRGAVALVALATIAALSACSAAPAEPPVRVLVVSDGSALAHGDSSWPRLIAGEADMRVEVDSIDGSSWITASPTSVRDRVSSADADVIVLALGVPDDAASVPDDLRRAVLADGIGAAVATGAYVIALPALGDVSGEWSPTIAEAANAAGAVYADVPAAQIGSDGDPAADRATADRLVALIHER